MVKLWSGALITASFNRFILLWELRGESKS